MANESQERKIINSNGVLIPVKIPISMENRRYQICDDKSFVEEHSYDVLFAPLGEVKRCRENKAVYTAASVTHVGQGH